MLSNEITQAREKKSILLMTHIVLGYPDFATSERIVDAMVAAGVDLIELQIPFSEPMADGPVILRANQAALAAGSTVERCFELAERLASRHPIPFLFMSYYNVLHRQGTTQFVERMARAGLRGAIVPDLPHEEGREYLNAMRAQQLDPIFIYSPSTSDSRMRAIDEQASGFVYCVARKGVTGAQTSFSQDLEAYLARCRAGTRQPLAVGFGVRERADVDFLRGKADIAVIGSETIRLIDERGVDAVGPFIAGLR